MGYLKQKAENAKKSQNFEQYETVKVSEIEGKTFKIHRLVVKNLKYGETAIADITLDSETVTKTCFIDKSVVLKQLKEAIADGYSFDEDGCTYRLIQRVKKSGDGSYWVIEEVE